ncbi:hypothetical protein C8Q73DRAFT_701109, partial [Cubamyces lactineus]
MMHGDVRLENIIIAKATGAEDEYPLHLSKDVWWPASVVDYALMQIEHDDELVCRL